MNQSAAMSTTCRSTKRATSYRFCNLVDERAEGMAPCRLPMKVSEWLGGLAGQDPLLPHNSDGDSLVCSHLGATGLGEHRTVEGLSL